MKKDKKGFGDWGIIQKKNKRTNKLEWYARIVRVDGNGKKKEYTRKAESKSEARRLRNELSENFEKRGENAIEGNKINFRELATIYEERRLHKAIYQGEGKAQRKVSGVRSLQASLHYAQVLRDYFGAKLIRNITHSDIEDFKRKRLQIPTKRGVRSIADVNRTLELMRAMLRFAVRQGWLLHSPFEMGNSLISKADETRRERVLSFEEESRLLTACTKRRAHLKPLIITALDTAMRRGELLKLTWDFVNFENRTITITAFNSKTAKERSVGLTKRVFSELSELYEKSSKDATALVFGIKDTVKNSFKSACTEAEIKDFRFHDLRHTAITRMVQAGLAPIELMKISGHSQINTFARYVNPDTNAIQRVADVLSAYQTQMTFDSEISETID